MLLEFKKKEDARLAAVSLKSSTMNDAFYRARLAVLEEEIDLMEAGGNINLSICVALRAILYTLRDLVEDVSA